MNNVCSYFFDIALKWPHKTALIFDRQEISYKDLADRANSLVIRLNELGVKDTVFVGIYLPRSVDLIASILAVLKAGAGYVPLDVSFPEERIKYILSNSAIEIVLTSRGANLGNIVSTEGVELIYLDDLNSSTQNESKIVGGKTAYVMYTSGSTGSPKGVQMGHGALINLIEWQGQISDISDGITLQYAPASFDVSFQEIFSTLSFGGTLVLCDEVTHRDPERLLGLVASEKIERIFLPFVALQQLAEVVRVGQVHGSLREVITAGEQLRITPAIRTFFKESQNSKLINQYGPTETHVVTAHELLGDPTQWPLLPSIGKPIQNVQAFVFDEFKQSVPVGEVGELYVGGASLAEGYINSPSLTGICFVRHPVSGARLYKTGDLTRLLGDGNLEFVGRVDNQVKIRGYRIELGEVEAVLFEHPAIRECVVDVRKDIFDQNKLVAYLVIREEYKMGLTSTLHDSAEWFSFLREKMPDYMIPSTFLILASLPLTPTGKVDRASLPNPSKERPNFATTLVIPQNMTEVIIADIWRHALQLSVVGVDDNFFELGGNSLLVTFVQQKLSQALPIKIAVIDLFQYPTIRLLAGEIERRGHASLLQIPSHGHSRTDDVSTAEKRIKARKRHET